MPLEIYIIFNIFVAVHQGTETLPDISTTNLLLRDPTETHKTTPPENSFLNIEEAVLCCCSSYIMKGKEFFDEKNTGGFFLMRDFTINNQNHN